MTLQTARVPYWLVNVPQAEWPAQCPESLRTISDQKRRILSTQDSEYHRLTWDEVKEVVRTNKLDTFQRVPSELRRYLDWAYHIKQRYNSIPNYVLRERLQWRDSEPAGPPFCVQTLDKDIKILHNDWPYGIDRDIVHLVVWTKFTLDSDAGPGDLTASARKQADEYVLKTFGVVPSEQRVWFRNWTSLKSVAAVEHFHVMLYKPDKGFVDGLTGGDEPLWKKLFS